MEAKAMALVIGPDLLDMCSSDQLCSGAMAGVEAAVHTMKALLQLDEAEGLLLHGRLIQ